jgi:folate-binding protein YgfZ
VTATFGDITGEYLALRRGAAAVTGLHEVVWVSGPDGVTFLDGLLSQSISAIPVGGGAPSLLLAPQGKLRATLWVLRGSDRIGLVADAGRGAVVVEDLTRFKIRVEAELALDDRPVVDVWGPRAALALSQAGFAVPDDRSWVDSGDLTVAALPFARSSLPRFVVVGAADEELDAGGIPSSGRLAAAAVRIEAGEPVMGVDIDEGTIPQEAGIVAAAVDFTKGCYLGQELVARIESRGRVNRHLRGLVITTNVLPPVGAEVVRGDRSVGRLSSVAESLELRAPVALALLRREAEPDDEVEIRWEGGSTTARVTDLPLDETL